MVSGVNTIGDMKLPIPGDMVLTMAVAVAELTGFTRFDVENRLCGIMMLVVVPTMKIPAKTAIKLDWPILMIV